MPLNQNQKNESFVQENDSFNFKTYTALIKRHWLPFSITIGSVFTLSILYAINIKPIYEARGLVLLQSQNQSSSLLAGIPSLGSSSGAQNQLNTQIEIFKTEPVLLTTIKSLNLRDNDNRQISTRAFQSNLFLSPIPRTDVFQVSYKSPDQEEAVKVVDNLMNSYISNNIRLGKLQKSAATQFIESQLPNVKAQLDKALQERQDFSESNNILAVSDQTTALINELSLLRQGISEKKAELAGLKDIQKQLESILGVSTSESNYIATLAESAGVQTAIASLQETEEQIAALRARYQPSHPQIQSLLRQKDLQLGVLNQRISEFVDINKLSKQYSATSLQRGPAAVSLLTQQITNSIQLKNVEQQLGNLQLRYEQQVALSNQLPELQKGFLLKELAVEVAKTRYTTLLEAYQTAQISENQDLGGAVIIQPAVPLGYPVSTSPLRVMFLGGILGVVLGLGVAYLLDQIDNTVHSEDEIRTLYSFLTVLGTIPQLNQPKRKLSSLVIEEEVERHTTLVVRDDPKLPASEAYRMLLANIRFSNSDGKLRVITVTSAMPGEGKSTTVANLALAMSELGLRIVIVDSDLRRPSQHDVWQIPNRIGLSNYLVDSSVLIADSLYSENDYLDVLTAGAIPPNPVSLLNSERYSNLLMTLSNNYDYVLIDAPPLTVAADALLMGRNSNTLLLVARPDKLLRTAALKAKESILNSGFNLLGLVINAVRVSGRDEMYYYYSAEENAETKQKRKFLNLIGK